MGVAVIGDHRRNRCEQADGRGDQRLGNARRHLREGGLAHIGEAAEGIHDAPHGAEQADIGTDRSYRRKAREMRFEGVDFALIRGAHCPSRAVERYRRGAALLAMLGVFAKAQAEDLLEARAGTRLPGALVQGIQVAAFPELLFEPVGLARRSFELEELQKNLRPRPDRQSDEQGQDGLNDDGSLGDEGEKRQVGMYVHACCWRRASKGRGIRTARHCAG